MRLILSIGSVQLTASPSPWRRNGRRRIVDRLRAPRLTVPRPPPSSRGFVRHYTTGRLIQADQGVIWQSTDQESFTALNCLLGLGMVRELLTRQAMMLVEGKGPCGRLQSGLQGQVPCLNGLNSRLLLIVSSNSLVQCLRRSVEELKSRCNEPIMPSIVKYFIQSNP